MLRIKRKFIISHVVFSLFIFEFFNENVFLLLIFKGMLELIELDHFLMSI